MFCGGGAGPSLTGGGAERVVECLVECGGKLESLVEEVCLILPFSLSSFIYIFRSPVGIIIGQKYVIIVSIMAKNVEL